MLFWVNHCNHANETVDNDYLFNHIVVVDSILDDDYDYDDDDDYDNHDYDNKDKYDKLSTYAMLRLLTN